MFFRHAADGDSDPEVAATFVLRADRGGALTRVLRERVMSRKSLILVPTGGNQGNREG